MNAPWQGAALSMWEGSEGKPSRIGRLCLEYVGGNMRNALVLIVAATFSAIPGCKGPPAKSGPDFPEMNGWCNANPYQISTELKVGRTPPTVGCQTSGGALVIVGYQTSDGWYLLNRGEMALWSEAPLLDGQSLGYDRTYQYLGPQTFSTTAGGRSTVPAFRLLPMPAPKKAPTTAAIPEGAPSAAVPSQSPSVAIQPVVTPPPPVVVPPPQQPAVAAPEPATHVVFNTAQDPKEPWLNLREGDDPSSPVVARMPDGTKLRLLGAKGPMFEVVIVEGPSKGNRGFAHSRWLMPLQQ
jgi:hypothetical protein